MATDLTRREAEGSDIDMPLLVWLWLEWLDRLVGCRSLEGVILESGTTGALKRSSPTLFLVGCLGSGSPLCNATSNRRSAQGLGLHDDGSERIFIDMNLGGLHASMLHTIETILIERVCEISKISGENLPKKKKKEARPVAAPPLARESAVLP